ncbi:D-methionine-binding lipoprotein MetQ precursor [compost metagenome]
MKKSWMLVLLVLVVVIAGCGNAGNAGNKDSDKNTNTTKTENSAAENKTATEPITIKVATLIPPMTDMLDIAKPILEKEGVKLEVLVLSDNVQPNDALANKEVDANFFQHVPYMTQYNESKDANLTPIQPIYFPIYGAYSKKYKSIDELPDGAAVAIANDPSNIGRSLDMLAKQGLIKLKEGVGINATQQDIVENSKNLIINEVDLLMLARMMDDVDLVLMTPAYAKPLGLTPKKDALFTEGDDSEFAVTLIAREDNKDSEAIQKLGKALASPEVKQFLEDNYGEISLPAF